MKTEGKNEKVGEYRPSEEGKRAVARIAGMIVARIGGTNPPITDALTKAEEIVRAVLKTEIKSKHVFVVAEIAGTIFAPSSEQDLSNKARLANSIQWATQIAQLTGLQ
jgi:hypothetical protein